MATATVPASIGTYQRVARQLRHASHPRHAHRTRRSSLRLTRRGRLALFLTALVAGGALVVGVGQGAEATHAVTDAATTTYVVQPGQSLWSVAQIVDPQSDPRAVIERIRDLNALDGSVVHPGQSLVIPNLAE